MGFTGDGQMPAINVCDVFQTWHDPAQNLKTGSNFHLVGRFFGCGSHDCKSIMYSKLHHGNAELGLYDTVDYETNSLPGAQET